MKKITRFFSLLFGLSCLTANAQTLVKDAVAELTDGTLISLQCRDTNGGSNYYFNGATAKTAPESFGKANLWIVKGNATDGLKLCRLSDGNYLKRSGDAISMTENADEAVVMTVANAVPSNWTTIVPGTDQSMMIRFTNTAAYLNCQNTGGTPKFFNGAGGYSAWYVYKYNVTDLDALGVDYTFGELDEAGVPVVCNVRQRITVAEIPETKFLVRGCGGRPGWLYAGGTTTSAPYIDNTEATPALSRYIWTAEKVEGSTENEFYLKSVTGAYLSRSNVRVFTTDASAAMKFRIKAKPNAEAGVFNLQTESQYLNMNGVENDDTNKDEAANFYPVEWNDVNDANGKWEFYPCNSPATNYNVTYVIKDNQGAELLRTTIATVEDEPYPQIPASQLQDVLPAFITLNYPEGTVNSDATIELTWTVNLPFEPSESFENAHWYALDVHSNESKYCVYVDETGAVRVNNYGSGTDYPYLSGQATEREQWCFVGNVWDGFKIYNRVAGAEVSLYQSSDADTEVTMDAAGNTFHLYTGRGRIANPVAIKVKDRSYYINHRQPKLQGWTSPDEGSSFRFFAVTETLTLAKVVQDQLDEIAATWPGKTWPTEEAGTDGVIWPNEYINGGFASFTFMDDVKTAVAENNETALAGYKTKLTTFINLSKEHGFPLNTVFTRPTAEVPYGTIYARFNAARPEGITLYECNSISADDGYTLVLTQATGNFQANKAYIVELTDESKSGVKHQIISFSNQMSNTQANSGSLLKGTHTDCVAPAGSYVLQNQQGVLGFYRVAEGKAFVIPAHKCYLQLPEGQQSAGIKCLLFPDGTLTSIDAVDASAPASSPAYDLSGRRVRTTSRGLYIVGGKKVLVK